ncbi:MAG: AAA family ATPase [Oscillospiraceae bacterium]|nr:AAA family ATPase [Oscillospiraceae bacterium]
MSAFDNIIGYRREKEELIRMCDALQHPEKYEALGVRLPPALLLYGAPGLGKTLFANTLIEESGLPCFACRKDRADGDFVASIAETFSNAAANAPSIVFLDDMDKFAEDNLQQDSNKEEFATIQSCMENVRGKRVFVLATANDIENIPESLMRVGRLGRQIEFSAPSESDAAEIIRHYCCGKPISKEMSAETLARILNGKSCAVLEEVVNEAGLLAGYENSSEIGRDHLIRAVLQTVFQIVPNDEPTDARRKSLMAYHEAGHAVAALSFGQKIGIISYNAYDLVGVCAVNNAKVMMTFRDILNDATVSLAGKAAVELKFGEADNGCGKDIGEATERIRGAMTKNCAVGFGYGYDRHSYDNRQAWDRVESISRKLYDIIDDCYQKAMCILKSNVELLDAIASELQTRSALIADDFDEMLLAHPIK